MTASLDLEGLRARSLTRAKYELRRQSLTYAPEHDRSKSPKQAGGRRSPSTDFGRWGGPLSGDWDSAIHLISEVLAVPLRPPTSEGNDTARQQELKAQWRNESESAFEVHINGLLGDVWVALTKSDWHYETLRVNALALMVYCRHPCMRDANTACGTARDLRDYLTRPKSSPWPSNEYPDNPPTSTQIANSPEDWASLLDEAWCELKSIPLNEQDEAFDWRLPDNEEGRLEREARNADRSPRHRRLRDISRDYLLAHLRGFVVLAALPEDAYSTPTTAHLAHRLYEALTDRTADKCCNWPPFDIFEGCNPLTRALHFVASRVFEAGDLDYDGQLQDVARRADRLYPRAGSARTLLKSLGLVPQLKDVAFALGLVAFPKTAQGRRRARGWARALHHTRGPVDKTSGIYCYLPLSTGMATAALGRYVNNQKPRSRGLAVERARLMTSIAQSQGASRKMRAVGDASIQFGFPFGPYALYNDVFITNTLRSLDVEGQVLAADKFAELLPGIEYILKCQLDDGMFQQVYASNELDEGETIATGVCLRTLAQFSRALRAFERADDEKVADLHDRIACAIERGVAAVLDHQNESGGFPTFDRTDREKGGLLGTHEQPGVQETLLFDAPAADSTAWTLEGLCEALEPIPGVEISQSLRTDMERAIDKGLEWLKNDFEPRAGWWARYGGGYITGTAMALRAFKVAGRGGGAYYQQRAIALFTQSQQGDGGWLQGQEADYPRYNKQLHKYAMRPGRWSQEKRQSDGQGSSNATANGKTTRASHPELTAFAVMGLLDAGMPPDDEVLLRAIRFLGNQLGNAAAAKGPDWSTTEPVRTFMRGWTYVDRFQLKMKPVEALLRWVEASKG